MTAKLGIGSHGGNAVRHATVEPRREQGRLFKNQRTEELLVRLWRKRRPATLGDAQVLSSSHLFIINIFTNLEYLVDCKVGDWKPWGECSATCGGGTKTREREVVQQPNHGGVTCPNLEETMACNTQGCPGALLLSGFLIFTI